MPDPPSPPRFTLAGRARSIRFAVVGLARMLRHQHNAWIHLAATVLAIVLGFIIGLSPGGWCVLVLTIAAVWTAEALNTAFEQLCDVASPQFHPEVEKAKDIAAGAVLITAIAALVVGAILLGPGLAALVF